MIRNVTFIAGIIVTVGMITGCLYRGEGAAKRIGDSDYKVRLSLMNLFTVADGRPTYVCGSVLMEDHLTPLKNTLVLLKKEAEGTVVTSSYTDHIGTFNMTAILKADAYIVEIDSPEYAGKRAIVVDPNKRNWHEIIAQKRKHPPYAATTTHTFEDQ